MNCMHMGAHMHCICIYQHRISKYIHTHNCVNVDYVCLACIARTRLYMYRCACMHVYIRIRTYAWIRSNHACAMQPYICIAKYIYTLILIAIDLQLISIIKHVDMYKHLVGKRGLCRRQVWWRHKKARLLGRWSRSSFGLIVIRHEINDSATFHQIRFEPESNLFGTIVCWHETKGEIVYY